MGCNKFGGIKSIEITERPVDPLKPCRHVWEFKKDDYNKEINEPITYDHTINITFNRRKKK